jgi:hypothetical protein
MTKQAHGRTAIEVVKAFVLCLSLLPVACERANEQGFQITARSQPMSVVGVHLSWAIREGEALPDSMASLQNRFETWKVAEPAASLGREFFRKGIYRPTFQDKVGKQYTGLLLWHLTTDTRASGTREWVIVSWRESGWTPIDYELPKARAVLGDEAVDELMQRSDLK